MLDLPKNKIKFIFEDNKLKQNKFLPIYSNKIVKTELIKKLNPKYLIVFAWNFKDDIKKVNKLDKRIKLIVPLQNLK